jgi:hypothetical protein
VRPYEEVGDHAGSAAAALSIVPPLLGGEVGGRLVEGVEADARYGECAHLVDAGEERADFRPDDRTDHQTPEAAGGIQSQQ